VINTLETIFPREANNDYQGSPIAFYGFLPIVAMQAFSACVHYFTYDSGKIQIAGMIPFEGTPDPSGLIFALGANAGAWELIILAIYGIVLWRYRNLIPLVFTLAIAKSLLGFGNTFLHPIDPAYFEHTPPALIVRLPRLGFEVLMLFLAVRQPTKSPAPAAVLPDHGH
jgi:hypothetical protein